MVLISNTQSIRIPVLDQSYIGAARRAVRDFALSFEFSETTIDRINILASEIASNLAKHAENGGEILVCDGSNDNGRALRLFSVDRGPGICDLDNALRDGVSSKNTLGAGLGAIKRLSDSFEISSTPGQGTVIVCTINQKNSQDARNLDQCRAKDRIKLGYISVAHPSESEYCGDAVSLAISDELSSILVVDGLGHGPGAAEVSRKAVDCFRNFPFSDPKKLVSQIHQALANSRGAALALVQIDHLNDKLSFVGVGNISGKILSRYTSKGCASVQGVVGSQIASLMENRFDWCPNSVLLMYSDGIKSAAHLDCGARKSANLLAAEIYRDYSRMNDDATVVVVKDSRSSTCVDTNS